MNKQEFENMIDKFEVEFADESYVQALFSKTLEQADEMVVERNQTRKSRKIHSGNRRNADKRSDDALFRNMLGGELA